VLVTSPDWYTSSDVTPTSFRQCSPH
jgi:hypothetical protein